MKRTLFAAALAALSAASAQAAPREWTLDLGHAHFGWNIDHMGLSHTAGRFNRFDGTFLIDAEKPEDSKITFSVDLASVDSNHVGRDNHIRSKDYFDVKRFPKATFTSTKVVLLTTTSGKITGDLNFRGVTAPLTLDFTMVADRNYPDFIPNYDQVHTVAFEATGELLRLDHGMDFIAFLGSPTGLSVDLDVRFDLVDCAGAPATNVPCHWGRVEGFKGPSE